MSSDFLWMLWFSGKRLQQGWSRNKSGSSSSRGSWGKSPKVFLCYASDTSVGRWTMIHSKNIKQLKRFLLQKFWKEKESIFVSSSENRLLPVAVLIGSLFYGTTALLFFMERIWKMFYYAHLCIIYYVHTCIVYMFHVKCLCLLSMFSWLYLRCSFISYNVLIVH